MKIGYARVSTDEQNLDLQIEQLRHDGCQLVFQETITGRAHQRPELSKVLSRLQSGDVLVVWKLDRLGRSLKHLIHLLQELESRGIGFRCIADGIDTGTSSGKLLFHIIGAIAEFECSLISERTKAGLQAARNRGQTLGRPKAIGPLQMDMAKQLAEHEHLSCAAIADRLNVGKSTLWRAMKQG